MLLFHAVGRRSLTSAMAFFAFLLFVAMPNACIGAKPLTSAMIEDEIELALTAPLYDLGGDAVLLPSGADVGIEAKLTNKALEAFGLEVAKTQIRWESDGGDVFDKKPSPRSNGLINSWRPPNNAGVSKVTIHYNAELRPRGGGASEEVYLVSRSASVTLISPTRPDQFNDGEVDGFRLGEYPDPLAPSVFSKIKGLGSKYPSLYSTRYLTPSGFYKVTEANRHLMVSKHFALGDYAMDYPWFTLGYPQYIALDWTLLRKYEDLIELMHSAGVEFSRFKLIYGFRSPIYNHEAMKRDGDYTLKTWFSMHQYGRAIDMIIDEDNDLVMDDMNGDGVHDIDDAVEVMKFVNVLDRRYRNEGRIEMVGGAGLYDRHDFVERTEQSPYVHMDVRGYLADGNILVRWPSNWPSGPWIVWSEIYPEGYEKKDYNYSDPASGSVY